MIHEGASDRPETLEALLRLIDYIDNAALLGHQLGDPVWSRHLALIQAEVLRTLGTIGVLEVPAIGVPFDEVIHEAVDRVAAADGNDPFQVVQLVRRGFFHRGSLLRRAQVVTSYRGI